MATRKPKIQGYIDQETFDDFEAYRKENNLTQSQALEKILASFFGSDRASEQSINSEFRKYVLDAIENLRDRMDIVQFNAQPDSDVSEEDYTRRWEQWKAEQLEASKLKAD